jgi:5-oxoprolinase (ATP-hydrolysing)
VFREKEMLKLLTQSRFPARNPAQNLADLKAQVAANARGAGKLLELVREQSETVVENYMRYVRENASLAVRKVIEHLCDGRFECEMDNGCKIVVSVCVNREKRSVRLDFTGTSKQVTGNFNAPRSICRAAVLYVFRTLVDQQIPLNDGCLEPIEMIMPEGTIINPCYPAAVVAGNVETSQAVTDCLYGALNALASAQGTMNNFTFGNDQYQYYETICGGSGAGPDFQGTSAVQTHMTNSRLTDPEVLELRFPVLLEHFSIRSGSGGAGKFRGGDGTVRRVRFLEAMTAAMISQRRRVPPFGLAGGGPGKCGRNYILHADGTTTELSGTAVVEMHVNDVFVIETPGGGAFGPA